MHVKTDGQVESPLVMALRAAARLMEIKLVSSPKDHVGILLWNTVCERSRSSGSHDLLSDYITYVDADQESLLSSYNRVRKCQTGECSCDI